MSKTINVDVVIIGGGMVGLVLALALVRDDFKVAVIENRKPPLTWDEQPNARVCALNLASLNILKKLDIWSHIDTNSKSSLQRLVVWDSVGGGEINFDSAQMAVRELGFIVENRALVSAAWQLLEKNPNAQLICDHQPRSLKKYPDHVEVVLDNHQIVKAALGVGADGANSWVREQLGSEIKTRAYQQKAIVAVVQTQSPHEYSAWQAFSPTGPLALLPLSDPNQCAIVWSQAQERADQLLAMEPLEFECELNNDFGLRLGEISYLHDRRAFPLIMRHAVHYAEPRSVLIGDAAHTIHPLAGQGVNLGFLDAAVLAECLTEAKGKGQDVGSLKPLRRYERWRKGGNAQMICAMRGFNDLFTSQHTASIQLRSQGFNFADRMPWLKKQFMKVALGKVNDLPSLAS